MMPILDQFIRCTVVLTSIVFCSAPVLADETWISEGGMAVYETEIGDMAVFSVPLKGERVRVYLNGLAGNYTNRSKSHGYWIGTGKGRCSADLVTPDGIQSSKWGRATVVFDKPSFPTGWTAKLGKCFSAKKMKVRADLQ